MRRLAIIVWLVVVWTTLWEVASWANLLAGTLVAAAVVYLLPPQRSSRAVGFRPVAALRLLFYFLWELIQASAFMAWEVMTPRNRIGAAVVSVPLSSDVAGVVTAVANMVSLTPGTVTLDVEEETRTIFVHVLHLKSVEETRRSVEMLEALNLAAFPPRPTAGATVEAKGAR
jgi:multicomponent Na+:H+ antiporter subunit E